MFALPLVSRSASGILFGGVVQGALLSAFGATIGSLVGFQLSRTLLRARVEESVQKQPVARALQKVVDEEGFKTVFVLRLSPLLPIPLGAYSYIYGSTSISPITFSTATFLGSIKPYLLDSYLGVFSKQIVDGGSLDGAKDAVLLVGVGALVLIGTFATDLAGESWEKVQAEMKIDADARAARVAAGEVLEDENDGTAGWGGMVGPFNTSAPAAVVAQVVPSGVQEELQGVWANMTAFCEYQWPAGIERAVDAKAERVALAESSQTRFGRQMSGEWNEEVLRRGESETSQVGGEVAANGAQPSVMMNVAYVGDGKYGAGERKRLALWVLDGPQPWRPLLTNLLFTFSLVRVISTKWSVDVGEHLK